VILYGYNFWTPYMNVLKQKYLYYVIAVRF